MMRIQMQRKGNSVWKFLVMTFTAIALAVVVLPGCGDDDTSNSDPVPDTGSPPPQESSPPPS
jgi:hypothetical protein